MNSNWKPYQDITKEQMQVLVNAEGYVSALLISEVSDAHALLDRGFLSQYNTRPVQKGDYLNITEAGKQYLQEWRKNYSAWMASNFS